MMISLVLLGFRKNQSEQSVGIVVTHQYKSKPKLRMCFRPATGCRARIQRILPEDPIGAIKKDVDNVRKQLQNCSNTEAMPLLLEAGEITKEE